MAPDFMACVTISSELAAIENFLPSKTTDNVIVDHPGGLHVRVTDRGADEFKAALLQVFAQRIRLCAGDRVICQPSQFVYDWFSVYEAPYVSVEVAKLLLNFQEALSVVDSRNDFLLITNDPRSFQQGCQFFVAVPGNLPRVEPGKSFSISFPLAQDCIPTQPGLSAFQCQKFKYPPVVMHRHTPLVIVVGNVIRLS